MAFGAAWPWLRAKVAPFTRDTARYLFICAAWYPVCYFVESHVVGTTRVRGPSMYPYLNENHNETRFGDVCLTWRLYAQQNLQRGMIVTFYNPMKPETLTIKRIIGLPGDMIHTKAPFPTPYIRVPPNHIWVEGDGTKSLDSNTYGPISIRLVDGQVTHILWPFRKAQRVKWWEHRLTDRLAATRAAVQCSDEASSYLGVEKDQTGQVNSKRVGSENCWASRAAVTKLEILSDLIEFPFVCLYKPANTARDNPLPGFPPQLRPPALLFLVTTCPLGIFQPAPAQTRSRRKASTAAGARQPCGDSPTLESQFPKDIARRRGVMADEIDEYEGRQPYIHSMIAGGLGGTTGDMLMHSLDTVKTRQQGDPHVPPKYTSLGSSYYTIFRQEGIRRGLYGGWFPALLGSFPGTVMFFGTYEFSKRHLLDYGIQPHVAYLSGGFLGDLAASIVYVPSEVLKTRLQLQGRYKNPHFNSGYNYRGTLDAARTIVRNEGFSALFYGYSATLYRDLPFSALQFMFWEQFKDWAQQWKGSREIGTPLEFLTGASAGGLAGAMTCPLDVVKTRLQTQVNPEQAAQAAKAKQGAPIDPHISHATDGRRIKEASKRLISTSSPSTHRPKPGVPPLDTSSVFVGLRMIYRHEGIGGWFRGVGPRFVWTSIQSGCMLFLYQIILRKLDVWMPIEQKETAI